MHLGHFHRRPCQRNMGQRGYLLITLMLMVTLLAMAALATGPAVATQIKRDREDEMIHRGAQYARAVKKFYKKFGRYPVSIDQLKNTNNIRFLRRAYKDPTTGEDFRLLHFGEVKLTPKGPGSATGPGVSTDTSANQSSTGFGTTSGFGTTVGSTPNPGLGGTAGGLQGTSTSGQPTEASDISKPIGSGPKFGGGPIIGVASTSEKRGLKEFNGKDRYNEWEFVYDPTMDRGGLIKGPYVPQKAGVGGIVPGGLTPTATPQGGLGTNPTGFGQPTLGQPTVGQPGSFGQPSGGSANPQPNQP